jgi:hypothetical protein
MSAGRAFALSPLVDLGAVYARKLSQAQNAVFISASEIQIFWYPPESAEVFSPNFFWKRRKNGWF